MSWRGERRFWAGRFFASTVFFSGAQLPFRVAGGAEGVEEAWGEVDFAGEEAARGFLTFGDVALARHSEQAPSALALCNVATAVEIGHSKVLLELVMHRFEIFC